MVLDILDTPIQFIRQYLTGWVLILIILFIIYFIYLRKLYTQRELFSPDDEEDIINSDEEEEDITNEGFQNETDIGTNVNTTEISASTKPTILTSNDPNLNISTTIFNNLQLSQAQLESARINYNQVIANYIIELGNLAKTSKTNPYFNITKQFDMIIANGIDKIINYMTNTIKTPNMITRTSLRTDILNNLNNLLETLIDQTNKSLVLEMNRLSGMNSTTIDYNTELGKINDSRNKLDTYIEVDKLLSTYGHNTGIQSKNINSILDKTMMLPIYERNFDKIQQLVNSDFNGNEELLTEKYGRAYTDFLEQEKKESLNINPLALASNIESGIVRLLTRQDNNGKGKNKKLDTNSNNIVEQYTAEYGYIGNSVKHAKNNPIPEQQRAFINTTPDFVENTNDNPTIYKDKGNRGNYLIEGFQNSNLKKAIEKNRNKADNADKKVKFADTDTTTNTSIQNTTKDTKEDKNILNKLLSGEFLQYIMDTTNSTMGGFYSNYDTRFKEILGNFKIEDNLLPGGFLLFVISLLLYFADITSPSSIPGNI
jgi:hypothetical protein